MVEFVESGVFRSSHSLHGLVLRKILLLQPLCFRSWTFINTELVGRAEYRVNMTVKMQAIREIVSIPSEVILPTVRVKVPFVYSRQQ
jgi:hypothetical protein